MSTTRPPTWDRLAAELVDTLQADRLRRRLPLHVRTAESRYVWPVPTSRQRPTLICVYCGRRRCREHDDLPALDPYYS